MGARDRLIAKIRNNPKDVKLSDACKVAGWLGFSGPNKATGHRALARPGEKQGLNFQDRGGGRIPAYQARQLIAMIEKYEDEL